MIPKRPDITDVEDLIKIMKEQGMEATLKALEECVGEEAPRGVCICEALDGNPLIITKGVGNQKKADDWSNLVGATFDSSQPVEYEVARSACSGKYVRKV
jgi:hypothetical protein